MRVVVCFPTVNLARAATATERWHARGYEVAVWIEPAMVAPAADLVVQATTYPGYWCATNHLARRAYAAGADVVVCIGDDMDPDPAKTAAELGAEFLAHFPGGLGVMQPTGDKMDGVDRICGSPWFGRGWLERAYLGSGPLWPEYGHYFGDEELQAIAKRHGLLWQRPDVCQYHHHWLRSRGTEKPQPYQRANNTRWWAQDKAIFTRRKAAGFPCSGLLELELA